MYVFEFREGLQSVHCQRPGGPPTGDADDKTRPEGLAQRGSSSGRGWCEHWRIDWWPPSPDGGELPRKTIGVATLWLTDQRSSGWGIAPSGKPSHVVGGDSNRLGRSSRSFQHPHLSAQRLRNVDAIWRFLEIFIVPIEGAIRAFVGCVIEPAEQERRFCRPRRAGESTSLCQQGSARQIFVSFESSGIRERCEIFAAAVVEDPGKAASFGVSNDRRCVAVRESRFPILVHVARDERPDNRSLSGRARRGDRRGGRYRDRCGRGNLGR